MQKKQTVALVMIVKNEELGLERAINSARPFVDEVVVAVDNSSSDKTLEIARKMADVVKTFDWPDDFAKARNFAQEGVKTDWLFFLDGHEYVDKCERLQEFLNFDCDGLVVSIQIEGGSEIRNPRFYKNGAKFFQAVHELQDIKKPILYPFFLVKHARVGGQSQAAIFERDKQRDDQVPRLLGSLLEKEPKNLRALFHLGMHAQSKSEWKKAIKYYRRYLKYSKFAGERWFIRFNFSLCEMALGHNLRAFWQAELADSETPGRWEIWKLKGLVYFQGKKYYKAVEAFTESFKINRIDCPYKPWPRDEASTWNIIGESFFNLKDYFRAHLAFSEATKRATERQLKYLTKKRADLMKKLLTKNPQ